MAITGNLVYKGLTITGAYVQIHHVFGGNKQPVNCVYQVFASLAARQADESNYIYDGNLSTSAPYVAGEDPVVTCYKAMSKAGGDFAGFTNC